jgi:hypothetical protein
LKENEVVFSSPSIAATLRPIGARQRPIAAIALLVLAGCNTFKKGTVSDGGADRSGSDARPDGLAEDAAGGRPDARGDGSAARDGAQDRTAGTDAARLDAAHRDATGDTGPVGIPVDHLVAYYPFNGNTNDESGNGKNAVANLGAFDTDRFGEANKAYNLVPNDDNDWYGIVSAPSLGLVDTFTLAIWIRAAPEGNNERIAGVGNWMGLQFAGSQVTFGWPGMAVITDPTAIVNDTWTFLVGVVTVNTSVGDTFVLYRDGNQVASMTFNDFFLGGSAGACRFYMGNTLLGGTNQNCTGSSQAYEFPGDVDDVRVYNRALSVAEIQALYHEQP